MNYTTIAIIFNPISTGPSRTNAQELAKTLKARFASQKIELIKTEYRGHAEELAYSLAKASKRPLIISSSGDGGYNEVINGALKAQKEGARPILGLLPSGNANDHYHNLNREDKDLIKLIAEDKTRSIDVLRLRGKKDGKRFTRYAHSYIGFGLTPHVGKELNKTKLNVVKESILVAKTLFTLKPVHLKIKRKIHAYDSVIFSNVDRMSKYFNISQPSRMTDGKFEVTIFRRTNKLKLIGLMWKASITNLKEDLQTHKFKLKTLNKTLVQLDGEIITLDPASTVSIGIEKQLLTCIV